MKGPVEQMLDRLADAYQGHEIPIPEHLYQAIRSYLKNKYQHTFQGDNEWRGKKLVAYDDTSVNVALQKLNIGSLFGIESTATDGMRIQVVEVLDAPEPKATTVIQTGTVVANGPTQIKPNPTLRTKQVF